MTTPSPGPTLPPTSLRAGGPAASDPRTIGLRRILYGGDYNPDQWADDVCEEDARLMRLAHWNVATLPVFSWARLNPAEGVYEFAWLDRIVSRLAAAGIDLCFATATASTPAWVDQQYPDVLTVDDQRRLRPHGNRHAFCPNSPNYRRLAGALVRALATRYGRHPGLALWHVNNEYGNSWPNYCYCPRCADGFRAYVEQRYRTLDGLNAAWSTAFWGHTFTSFSQVEPPYAHGEGSIQALKIDWRRFQSASYLACFQHEAAILREITPDVPITTNLMGAFPGLDYHAWASSMDVIAWDNYPPPDAHFADVAFHHALMRGLKDGQPFLLLEQTPSQQNWAPYCRLKPPGRLRLQSYQAIANGAESVMYFQWRRSAGGIEKLHGAVVEHPGKPEARVFREVSALGAELVALGERTLSGRTPARVAVLFDWECWWALVASSGPTRDLDYPREVQRVYAALHKSGIQTDVVGPDADLGRYDVIVTPTAYLLRAAQARRIADRVREGATLVTTFFSALVDENDRVHAGGAPGPLRDVLGVTVEEFDALPPDLPQGVRFDAPFGDVPAEVEIPASLLCDRVWLEGAQPLARYAREFYAGDAAVTVNAYGTGKAYYVGTRLNDDALGRFLRSVCAEARVVSPLRDGGAPPDGVEVAVRAAPGGRTLLYLLNHGAAVRDVPLAAGTYADLLTERTFNETASLAAGDVLILERRP